MLENLIDDSLIDANDRLLIGVSGGADSMLLLCALIAKQKQLNFEMEVMHINHSLRDSADGDARFVEEFCHKNKIKEKTIKINVTDWKNNNKLGIEEAARELRYQAFFDEMKKEKLNKLFVAHHKNDQAETVLMHIFRGSGILGAAGIRNSINIKRPFLNLSKSEILELCNKNKIKYVQDETNFDDSYSRNFIRNQVLPLIEKKFAGGIDAICNFSDRCNEQYLFILSLLKDNYVTKNKDYVFIDGKVFAENKVLVREYLKKAFEQINIFSDIEAKHYLLITDLFNSNVNKQIDLPHNCIAVKTYDGIKLQIKKNKVKTIEEYEFQIGDVNFKNKCVILTNFINANNIIYGSKSLYCDYEKIPVGSVWRTRKDGDIFAKFGSGSKKLNDYFTDKKIELSKRDEIPILAYENKVLIVAGYDISEYVKIDSDTEKYVEIKFTTEENYV